MKTVQVDIDKLKAYDKNPRNITQTAIDKVARSIEEFGFNQPIVATKAGVIIAGHTRFEAAQKLGLKKVPVLYFNGTAKQAKAYRISDNRTAEETGWLDDILADELKELEKLGFDGKDLGFEEYEIARILQDDSVFKAEDEWDDMPEFNQENKTSFRSIIVHFKNEEMVQAFTELVEQNITDSTKFIWYPENEIESYADKRYIDE